MNRLTCEELWVICCKSAMAISEDHGYFQNGDILIIFVKIHRKFKAIKVIVNVKSVDKNCDKVYKGLQYGCKHKSVALLCWLRI